MFKVLFADSSAAFSKRAAEELSAFFEVRVCKTGKEALEEYFAFRPDILVLELELPDMDGMGVLHALYAAGHRIPVLALSVTFSSNYVQQNLVRLGVEFALPKPCTVTAVISRLQEMVYSLNGREWTVEDSATSLLLSLGFSPKVGFFRYVHDALCMLAADKALYLTKVVYVEVGRRCGASKEAVERGIRCAIEKAWKSREDQVWRCFFAPGNRGSVAKPTNSAFLHRMVIALENKKIV